MPPPERDDRTKSPDSPPSGGESSTPSPRPSENRPRSGPPPSSIPGAANSARALEASAPARSPKRERSAAATQERILDAAEDEFAAHGFAGARLREIARGAQVQPALIHHYFADKHGLYEAVVRRAVDQMSTASWRVLESRRDMEGIVRGFVDVMVDFSAEHQKLLAIMRSEVLAGAGTLVSIIQERTKALLDAVVAMTKNLQAAGVIRDDVEPTEVVRSGLSLILYPIVEAPVLGILLPEENGGSPLERRKWMIAEVLLGGIRSRRA